MEKLIRAVSTGTPEKELEYVLNMASISSMKQRKAASIHPSSIGYCLRKHYYNLVYDPPKYQIADGFKIRRMQAGTDAHNRIEKYLEKAGVVIEKEKTLSVAAEYMANGRVDIIVRVRGEVVACEIKTVSAQAFLKIQRTRVPRIADVFQLQYYLFRTELETGYLIYESRDNQKIAVIKMPRNNEIIQSVKDRMLELKRCYDNRVLPDRDKTSLPCQRICEWYERCVGDGE